MCGSRRTRAACEARCELVHLALKRHGASPLPAPLMVDLRPSRWRPRLPSRLPANCVYQAGGPPVIPGRVGDGEAEAVGGQSYTWAKCAGPQRGEWGRLGPGSPSATPICSCSTGYRQIGFIHGHVGGGSAARLEHAHTGVGGLSMPQSRHMTPALGPGRLGEGAWHSLAPGFG